MKVENWEVVERSDTWNVKQGKRCIARLQKKAGAHLEARRIAATPQLEQAVRLILGLDQGHGISSGDTFRDEADTGHSPEPETVSLSYRTRIQLLNALADKYKGSPPLNLSRYRI